jgi:hypothetical protein
VIAGAALAVAGLGGCVERRVSVTSDPSGALVYANDVELGLTPLEASFRYYGTYDVRVEKEGFEPQRLNVAAREPLYEYPPLDIVAMAVPANIEHVVKWNFKLEPMREAVESREELEKGLLERAKGLRGEIK